MTHPTGTTPGGWELSALRLLCPALTALGCALPGTISLHLDAASQLHHPSCELPGLPLRLAPADLATLLDELSSPVLLAPRSCRCADELARTLRELLHEAGFDLEDVQHLVSHVADLRATRERAHEASLPERSYLLHRALTDRRELEAALTPLRTSSLPHPLREACVALLRAYDELIALLREMLG